MRFYKREIGKKVIIKWDDTISHLAVKLEQVLKEGCAKKTNIGWLAYYDKDKVILKSEKWAGDDSGDYTLIPRGMITEVRVLDD